MVCLGNICRSPLAEGIMRAKIKSANLFWKVESAGTNGLHNGEAPHYLSQKVARQKGLDISKQRSRKFEQIDVENYDYIFAMANDVMKDINIISKNKVPKEKVFLFLDAAYPDQEKEVPDPWYGGEDGYIEVYKIIEEGCEAILKKLEKEKY
jgi:protein-tyrosine phosphatase